VSRVVVVANLKGGVAKTTTVAALGAVWARDGLRTLLVDLDAQACLTYAVGVDPDSVDVTVAEALRGSPVTGAVVDTSDGPWLLPSDLDLAGAEEEVGRWPKPHAAVAELLAPFVDVVDVVVVDCSPSLGPLTVAALAGADALVVPMTADILGHRAVGHVLETVDQVRRSVNPQLRVLGVVATMVDGRTAHAREVLADVPERFGLPVLAVVPRSVRVAESAARGRSIVTAAPRSHAAAAYRGLASRVLQDLVGEADDPPRTSSGP
jgi:chromosome partitioning protein